MSFFRKLARQKAPLPLPGPSSQEGATGLATSDAIAKHGPLTELPPTEGQRPTTETENCAPDRSGHGYDRVQIGGESRNHLGDVYNRNVTYNYGAPFLLSESTEEQREDEKTLRREAARLKAENRLEEEKSVASEHRRLDFLQALRPDAMDSRRATIGLAHTDTCTWIVEAPEYLRWRDKSYLPTHHGVLWIKGNPGSGKSTLIKYALSLAQERDDGDIVVSFLFNARGQPLEKSAEGMYRSLLYQVLSKLPHLYDDRTHIKQQTWSIEMLETMLQTTVLALKRDEHLVLYIDALDECFQDEVRDVIGHLEDLVDLAVSRGLRFSICLSSRHYPHITMHKFEELILDNRYEHLEDIFKYVHSNVNRLRIPQSAKTMIGANINRRSSGIFLWAVLVIKILKEKCDEGAPLSELMSSLAEVPDKLGSLFTTVLAQCDKDTITALKWTLYTNHSLSPTELYFAIKIGTNQISTGWWDADDVDMACIDRFITRSTRGLVEVVTYGAHESFWSTQFIHESVREHLLQGGLASLTMGVPQLVEGSAHAQIAQYCLSYIQLDSPKYLQYFEPHRSLSEFDPKRFPLHGYATHNLLYHANLAYLAGALSLTFLSELPLKLLIYNQRLHPNPFGFLTAESATLLSLLLSQKAHALAEALLAGCSRTAIPGIVTFGTTAHSVITFDINISCDNSYLSTLGIAAMHGQIQLMQQLLYLGAEVDPSDKNVKHPLLGAVASRRKDIVEWLLQHGACTNVMDDSVALNKALFSVITASGVLGGEGAKDIVELLMQHGADASAVTDFLPPQTVLMAALNTKDHDIVSMLLAYGADVNYRNKFGTALDYALRKRHTKIARLLWEAQFPASEWGRTLLACKSQTVGHRDDTATVHRIEYHTGDGDSFGIESGSDVDSSYQFDGGHGDDYDNIDNSENREGTDPTYSVPATFSTSIPYALRRFDVHTLADSE